MAEAAQGEAYVTRLAIQAGAIRQLCAGVSRQQARWRPNADSWSLLEVVNHLADEEREDFRARLDGILHRPDEAWAPIAPGAWVRERGYNRRELPASLARFTAARQESLEWLEGLELLNLELAAPAPWGGQVRAGDMLAAWVAHDLLHMRQLVELNYAWTQQQLHPFSLAYAGDW